jgi:hypothetical protein
MVLERQIISYPDLGRPNFGVLKIWAIYTALVFSILAPIGS